jgi:hypothetical protein
MNNVVVVLRHVFVTFPKRKEMIGAETFSSKPVLPTPVLILNIAFLISGVFTTNLHLNLIHL